mmetsp:Transcript_61615/g.148311  ORF Transcript_61615/g.148311 Transcript_61615/m.148311 type:complete len:208 (-) Transcript_61615:212-835(-)
MRLLPVLDPHERVLLDLLCIQVLGCHLPRPAVVDFGEGRRGANSCVFARDHKIWQIFRNNVLAVNVAPDRINNLVCIDPVAFFFHVLDLLDFFVRGEFEDGNFGSLELQHVEAVVKRLFRSRQETLDLIWEIFELAARDEIFELLDLFSDVRFVFTLHHVLKFLLHFLEAVLVDVAGFPCQKDEEIDDEALAHSIPTHKGARAAHIL